MIRDLKHPIRREFLLGSLGTIETNDISIFKAAENWLLALMDYIGDMVDILGTTNVNKDRPQHKQIRSIFGRRKRLLGRDDKEVKYIPGVGAVKIERVQFDD